MLINKINLILDHVSTKNQDLHDHLERTALFSFALAKILDLNPKDKELAYFAGLLHDVGEIYTNENSEEKEHITHGTSMLLFLEGFEEIVKIIKYHHVHWKKQEDIPLISKIVFIASEYDNMRNVKKLAHNEAVKELMEGVGSKYDPHMVNPFIRVIEDEELV